MTFKPSFNQELIHVTGNVDEPFRRVIFKAVNDKNNLYWQCWIPSNKSMQPLSSVTLFPAEMETALNTWNDDLNKAKRILNEVESRMYKLLNQRSEY